MTPTQATRLTTSEFLRMFSPDTELERELWRRLAEFEELNAVEDLQGLHEQIDDLELNRDEYGRRIDDLESEMGALRDQIDDLAAERDNLADEVERLENELKMLPTS